DGLALPGHRVSLSAGDVDQLPDECGQAIDLFLNAIDGGVAVGGRPRELRREAESRQWRTQLVRNILQKLALRGHQRMDPPRHFVEGPAEPSDLVVAVI